MKALAAALLALLGCASPSSDASVCQVTGTYAETGNLEPGATCISKPGPPVTITVTDLGDHALVEVQGLTGGCAIYPVTGCKFQGKCTAGVSDALQPGALTTVQYSWTFTAAGFEGTTAVSIPPATSVPKGCSGVADVTATRR